MRAVVALLIIVGMPWAADAQTIEGRWKLLAAEDLRADGTVARYPWGRNPIGSIVVDRGWCYVQIMSSDVPAFTAAAPAIGEQMSAMLLSSYIVYSGACTVDDKEGSVTLKVDAAWRPNYVGTEQKRFFRIEKNRMFFGPAPNSMRTEGGQPHAPLDPRTSVTARKRRSVRQRSSRTVRFVRWRSKRGNCTQAS